MTDFLHSPIYKPSYMVYKYISKLDKMWRNGR